MEHVFERRWLPVGVFDGVALAVLDGPSQAVVAAVDRLARSIDRGSAVALPDGRSRWLGDRQGRPTWVPVDSTAAAVVAVVPLTPEPLATRTAGPVVDLQDGERAGAVVLVDVAVVEPVRLGSARVPLSGARTHLYLRGEDRSACGRLPVEGEHAPTGAVDCVRCLRRREVADAFAAQLTQVDRLAELVGPIAAARCASVWPRLDHAHPAQIPQLLDGIVGAVAGGVFGAPSVDRALTLVGRHWGVASGAARNWAAAVLRPRVLGLVARLTGRGHDALEIEERLGAVRLRRLTDAATRARLFVEAFDRHGPVPALEPMVLTWAREAGDEAVDRVRQWRRLHEIAVALGAG